MIFYYQISDNQNAKWIQADAADYDRIKTEVAYHISIYKLSHAPQYGEVEPPRYKAPLWFDVDCEGNIPEAKRQTTNLIKALTVPPEQLEIFATGGKGFHVVVHGAILGADKPTQHLPLYHKYIAKFLSVACDVPDLDTKLYNEGKGKLIRVENKQRSNGAYKVPITYDELLAMDADSYAEVCSKPRLRTWEIAPPARNEKLRDMYLDAVKNVDETEKAKAISPISHQTIKNRCKGKAPKCWEAMESGKFGGEGKTNQVAQTIGRMVNAFGITDISKACENNATKNTPVDALIGWVQDAAKSYADDTFSCGYVRSHNGFSGSICKGCPLNNVGKLAGTVKSSTKHIANILTELKADPNNKPLGETLAKCYALKVPKDYSVNEAVQLTISVCTAISEGEAREIIEESYTRKIRKIEANNKLSAWDKVTRVTCDDWTPEQFASFIAEKSFNQWGQHEIDEGGIYCEKFVRPQVFFDARGMGSGKTWGQAALVDQLKKGELNISTCYSTSRVGLTKEAAVRLKVLDYQTLKDDEFGTVAYVATCVNSLNKFQKPFDVLIIDEGRQVLEHLLDSRTIKNREKTLQDFLIKYKSARLVIVADADLNDHTVNFFTEQSREAWGYSKEFTILETSTKPHSAKHIKLSSHDAARHKIRELYRQGKRGTVACTSKTEAKMTYLWLKRNGVKRILILTDENKGNRRQREFLEAATREAANYDVVIYSPVLNSGVSIEFEGFTFAFLLNTCVLPSNEALQMLGRNRCAKECYVSFGNQINGELVTNADAIIDADIEAIKEVAESRLMQVDTTITDLQIQRANVIVRRNDDLNDFENNFLILAEIKGRGFKSDADFADEKIKDLRKDTIEEMAQDRLAAEVITWEEAKLKKEKETALTQEQSNSIRRASTVFMAGTDDITIDDVINEENRVLDKVQGFEFLEMDKSQILESEVANLKTKNKIGSKLVLHRVVLELLNILQGEVTYSKALEGCALLKKHYKALSIFADYNKSEFDRPVKTLQNFLGKFGYKLQKLEDISKRKNSAIYTLKIDETVALYAARRKALRCGLATDFSFKKQVTANPLSEVI